MRATAKRAALGQAGSVVTPGRVDEQTLTLLAEALAALGEAGPPWQVRLLGRMAMEYLYSSHRDRREALSREALDIGRRLNDHATLAFALNARHFAILGPDTLEQRLAVSIEISQLAEAAGDRELALQSFPWRLADLLDLGHVGAADRLIETAARQADELRHPLYRWYVAVFRAIRTLMEGRLAECEGLIEAAYRLILKEYPGMPIFHAMRALALLQAGQAVAAQAELAVLVAPDAPDLPALPRDQLWLAAVALLAEASAPLGDQVHAARLYWR